MHFMNGLILLGYTSATANAYATGSWQKRTAGESPDLAVRGATLTSKWIEGSDLEQVIELVRNKAGVAPGIPCDATVVATWGQEYGDAVTASQKISGACGFGDYEPSESSLSSHWNPDWLHEVKYGIFIHWGLYAAPGYGNKPGPSQDYAEWYGFRMTQPDFKSQTYQYHRETYGEDFNYDQFMSNFTDEHFDAQDWINLIADAGAKYFVPVTKHHDGWVLFNFTDSISKRSTVHYGPKRDFIKELFDVAKEEHPEIRRGTYFSMPEWFNPAYVEYGFDQNYQGNYYGRPPTNPCTNESIEYTGYVEVDDYIDDIQSPQMETLFYNYDSEILWCDIGGPNKSPEVIAPWLNWARDQNRQVTWNDRCGIGGDYATPEYAELSFSVPKFESNRGMDPFSYGFNYMTKDTDYMTVQDIVLDLVNTVINNGNFLLNIGPKNDGMIPEAQRRNLLDAGAWIHSHGEGIFGTRYWGVARDSGPYRYVVKPDAFFIHHIGQPASQVVFKELVPWLEGDKVTVVGGSEDGTILDAARNGDGDLVLELPNAVVSGDKYVWTFKITYATGG